MAVRNVSGRRRWSKLHAWLIDQGVRGTAAASGGSAAATLSTYYGNHNAPS
jgi:hypothetical protein